MNKSASAKQNDNRGSDLDKRADFDQRDRFVIQIMDNSANHGRHGSKSRIQCVGPSVPIQFITACGLSRAQDNVDAYLCVERIDKTITIDIACMRGNDCF